ncbi:MAG: GNAT family N-acetyltransferase [Promethearchaeati archaeon SRVP18_Atabeyarchaeia-1]
MKINSKYYKFYQMQMDLKKINLIEAKKVPGLIIRNYGPSDSGQLVKVFNLVFSGTNDPFPIITESDLGDLPSDRIIIAEIRNLVVGFLMCGIKNIEGKMVGVIGYLGVLKEHRRKGIATSLAVEAGKYFLQNRLTKIIAEVFYLSKDSYKFIEGFGFEQTATIRVPGEEIERSLFRVKPP